MSSVIKANVNADAAHTTECHCPTTKLIQTWKHGVYLVNHAMEDVDCGIIRSRGKQRIGRMVGDRAQR